MAIRKPPTLLLTALLLPALAYAGVCGFMYAKQRELMYYPQATRLDAIHTDFQLARGDATLRGWQIHPGRKDALIYFGGNAEAIEGMRTRLAEWFPDRSIYLVSYRGYGASDGSPEESLLFGDALAIFDHAQALHAGGSISVMGRSLGSGVASYLASRRPVDRLVLVAPFDSLAAVAEGHYPWLPVQWLLRDRYDSDLHLARYDGPVLVVRAGMDRVVPPASTDRLITRLPRPPQVVEVPAASHDSVLSGADEARAVVEFVNQ